MSATWADDIVARLTDTTRCPACGAPLASAVCAACGIDAAAKGAHEVWRLSVVAATTLEKREAALDAMRAAQAAPAAAPRSTSASWSATPPAFVPPMRAPSAPHAGGAERPAAAHPVQPGRPVQPSQPSRSVQPGRPAQPGQPRPTAPSATPRAPAPTASAPPTSPPTTPARTGPGISLQPILAGAGAGLLAVSAIVFVFFTFGDNLLLRAIVTGIVTAAAVTVGALLRRAGLRTTSEAVAALAVVLAWVDVELGRQAGLLGQLDPELARAVVLAVLAPGFVALGSWLRVRSWATAGLVSAPVVPVLAAAGLPGSVWSVWWWVLALVLVAVLARTAMRTADAVGARTGTRLVAEVYVLRVLRAAGVPAALAVSFVAQAAPPLSAVGATAVLWSGVVAVAAVLGYRLRVRAWTTTALLAAPLVPVLVAAGLPGSVWSVWWWVLALVLVAVLAWTVLRVLPAFARRLGGGAAFELESGILRVVRAAAPPLALAVSLFAPAYPALMWQGATAVLWSGVVLFAAVLGYWLRVRAWTSAALVAVPLIPALVAAALPWSTWSMTRWVLALVLVAVVAWVALRAATPVARRLGASFAVEKGTLLVVGALGFPLALVLTFVAGSVPPLTAAGTTAVLWSALVGAALTLGSWLRVRSWLSAALLAAPVVPVLVAAALPASAWTTWWWVLALVLAAVVAWVAMRLLPAVARRLGVDLGSTFAAESGVLQVVRAVGLPAALTASAVAALVQPVDPLTRLGTTTILWSAVVVVGVLLGHALRVRGWTSAGVLAAPGIPLLLIGVLAPPADSWLPTAAVLCTALATLLGRVADLISGRRIASRLRAENLVLDVLALVAVPVAVLLAFDVRQPGWLPGLGGTAVLVALTAASVAVLRRVTHHRHWTVFGGVLAVAAGGLLGAVGSPSGAGWIPFGAGCAWLVLALATAPRLLRTARLGSVSGALAPATRDGLLLSGWTIAAAAAAPAVLLLLARTADAWAAAWSTDRLSWDLPSGALVPLALSGQQTGETAVLTSLGLPYAHLGTVAIALVTLLAARLARRGRRTEAVVAPWLVLVAVLGLALDTRLLTTASLVALALLAFVLVAATVHRQAAWRGLRPAVTLVQGATWAVVRASGRLRLLDGTRISGGDLRVARTVALTGAFAVTGLVLSFSWVSRPTAAVGALVVCALLLALRGALPTATRPWLVGVGYVYPLVVLGVVLGWLDLSAVAVICTVSAVASLVTILVTLGARTSRAEWYVVLGVTAGPFAAGVVTVVFERTWWSAGAAAAMLALELVLLLTARAGLAGGIRSGAAFLLLPTASVMVTSVGAMLLEVSGSPYVLPTTALFVSAVAGGAARIAERIATRVPDAEQGLAPGVRRSLERSALLTGAITIFLAYARPAAGSDVAVAVLLLLTAGAVLVAREPGRRQVWPLAGALALAALWTALAGGEVRLVEAYTFPPALAAVAVGAFVAWRSGRTTPGRAATHAWRLAAVGAALAVLPSLIVHLTRTEPADWRAFALVGGAVAALAVAYALGWRLLRERFGFLRDSWTTPVRRGLLGVTALAVLGGLIESLHVAREPVSWLGSGTGAPRNLAEPPRLTWYDGAPLGVPVGPGWVFAVGLGWALVAGVVLVGAAVLARRSAAGRSARTLDRWGLAPGLVLGTVGAVANARPVWGSIIALLVLEIVLLMVLVLVTRQAGRPGSSAPPWLVWLCATAVAIAAWAPRELRVEAFSVLLGAGLIWAGATALRRWVAAGEPQEAAGTLMTWPVGFGGSWRTVGWGIAALVGPSVLSTATDPLTVRASWVVLAALAAVLVGSRLRLSAPFWIGVWTLAVEVVIVFAKLGVGVSPLPWILTLVPAAVVLLIIATLDERRTSASGGTAAYLRDLR